MQRSGYLFLIFHEKIPYERLELNKLNASTELNSGILDSVIPFIEGGSPTPLHLFPSCSSKCDSSWLILSASGHRALNPSFTKVSLERKLFRWIPLGQWNCTWLENSMKAGVWLLPALQHPGRAPHRWSAECLLRWMQETVNEAFASFSVDQIEAQQWVWRSAEQLLAEPLKRLHNYFSSVISSVIVYHGLS